MKKILFAALVAAFILCGCEKSTFVGIDPQEMEQYLEKETEETPETSEETPEELSEETPETSAPSEETPEEPLEEIPEPEVPEDSEEETPEVPEDEVDEIYENPINPTPNIPEVEDDEIEKILPESWGKIVGAGISAVPADDVDGAYAKKCMVIRTEQGAVAVSFNMDEIVPEEGAILASYFVEGNFSSEYNGGLYSTDRWVPAISKDMSDRIAYFVGDTCKRNIRNTTLARWNWRDGNWSTVVAGYDFQVDEDVLSIFFDGELYMQIR